MSDSRPTRYREDTAVKLRRSLGELFAEYRANLNVIILAISVFGNNSFDYGRHELTLKPKDGAGAVSVVLGTSNCGVSNLTETAESSGSWTT